MELPEQAAVLNLLKARRGYAALRVLDKPLHQVHAVHIRSFFVLEVYIVLPPFGKVFLCHFADGVGIVQDIILARLLGVAVYGEISPHNHAINEPPVLVLHRVAHRLLRIGKGLEIRQHGWRIHKGNLLHPAILAAQGGAIDGYAVDSCYSHFVICFLPVKYQNGIFRPKKRA